MEKSEIQAFWGDLYHQLYSANDSALTPEILERQIDELEDLFRIREQPCVVKMDPPSLAGKQVLEIGSGGGGHSCIFKRYGANVTAVDLTAPRVASTARKFSLLKGGTGVALQADAGMRQLFNRFDVISLRKWSFQFDDFCVPRLTQIRRWILRHIGFRLHPGGVIVYGQPVVPDTAIERLLGRFLGFGWVIKVTKPDREAP